MIKLLMIVLAFALTGCSVKKDSTSKEAKSQVEMQEVTEPLVSKITVQEFVPGLESSPAYYEVKVFFVSPVKSTDLIKLTSDEYIGEFKQLPVKESLSFKAINKGGSRIRLTDKSKFTLRYFLGKEAKKIKIDNVQVLESIYMP